MAPLPRIFRAGCVWLLACLAPGLQAEDAAGQTPPADSSRTPSGELYKIPGIFNSDLPKTVRKGSIRLLLNPRGGDILNRAYFRTLAGIRWGLNDHTELTAAVEAYFNMTTKDGPTGNGIGDYQFGVKYGFREKLFRGYDTSVGLNTYFPVGRPPVDLTTGYDRYSPYIVIGKKIASRPGLLVFVNTGANLLRKTSVPGLFPANTPHSSSLAITPGFLYDHGSFHYTFEFTYETTSLLGRGNKQFVTLRPGLAWDLPPKLKFHAKGRWTIGASFRITAGPDGITSGASGKLRLDLGITRWFRKNAPADSDSR